MYGDNYQYASAYFAGHFPLLDMATAPPISSALPPPLVVPSAGNELDPTAAAQKSEVGYSSSGCSSYGSPSSLTSYSAAATPSLIEQSVSSTQSFHQKNINGFGLVISTTSSLPEFVESENSPMRRVFSTGDLQRINMAQHYHRSESPLSNENNSIIVGCMSKACRYSPEEKKERIERYKSKRNQRNFTKKIKYACRKTLADSRPRIRGRFARNDEIEQSYQNLQWIHMAGEVDENWINFLDSISANLVP